MVFTGKRLHAATCLHIDIILQPIDTTDRGKCRFALRNGGSMNRHFRKCRFFFRNGRLETDIV